MKIISFMLITVIGLSVPASAQFRDSMKRQATDPTVAAVDPATLDRAALGNDAACADEKDIVGSWLLTITPGGAPQFNALGTFGVDGTFTGVNQGDICCGSNSSGDHGAWKKMRDREFALTFLQLVYDPNTGALTGMYKVEGTIQLGTPGWHGTYTLYVYDAQGNLTGSDTGTFTAVRFRCRPLIVNQRTSLFPHID